LLYPDIQLLQQRCIVTSDYLIVSMQYPLKNSVTRYWHIARRGVTDSDRIMHFARSCSALSQSFVSHRNLRSFISFMYIDAIVVIVSYSW